MHFWKFPSLFVVSIIFLPFIILADRSFLQSKRKKERKISCFFPWIPSMFHKNYMNLSQRNKIKFLIGVLVMLWEVQLCESGFSLKHEFRLSLLSWTLSSWNIKCLNLFNHTSLKDTNKFLQDHPDRLAVKLGPA